MCHLVFVLFLVLFYYVVLFSYNVGVPVGDTTRSSLILYNVGVPVGGTTRSSLILYNVGVPVGDTARFDCILVGNPAVTVTWYKDSAIIENGDGITIIQEAGGRVYALEIENVIVEDGGLYEVRGENVNGAVTCGAELIVLTDDDQAMEQPPPTYTQQIDNCIIGEGKMARFDCQVLAWPHPEIIWLKDGKVLTSSDRIELVSDDDSLQTLVIACVEKSDAGRYVCWARNDFGEAFTEAYLNIIPKDVVDKKLERIAPSFTKYFHDLITVEGQPSEFKFKFESKPDATIQFYINKKDLPPNRYDLTHDEDDWWTFRIKETDLKDAGTVTCRLTNPIGFDTCYAELLVIEDLTKPKLLPPMAPKFITRFTDVDVNIGFEARYKCKVIGEPQPIVTWYKDGEPITSDNTRFKLEDYGEIFILIIEESEESDAGEYLCKAENAVGTAECSARLDVTTTDVPLNEGCSVTALLSRKGRDGEMKPMFGYPPVFTKLIQDSHIKQHESAQFSCRAYGMPEPDILWLKDGNPIPDDEPHITTGLDNENNYTLQVRDARPSDAGSYTCQLRNFAGRAACSAYLTVKPDPVAPSLSRHPQPVIELIKPDVVTPSRAIPFAPTRRDTDEPLRAVSKTPSAYFLSPPEMSLQKPYLYDIEPTSVRLSWMPARNPPTYTGSTPLTYVIEMRELPDALWSPVARDIHDNRYIVYDLEPEREYMFRVRARNADGSSEPTAPEFLEKRLVHRPIMRDIELMPLSEPLLEFRALPPPGIPILPSDKPTFLDIREDTARINWLPAHIPAPTMDYSAVLYDLETSDDSNRTWHTLAADIQGTSFFLHNLHPDRQYSFRIVAHNKHGTSGPTNVATLDRYPKEVPKISLAKPFVSDIGRDSLRLTWPSVDMEPIYPPLTYHIEAQELPKMDWRQIATPGIDTSFRITDLIPDQDYRFRIRAENEFGLSDPTDALYLPRATAYPGVPITRPTLTDIEPYAARLQWTTVDIPDHEGRGQPLRYLIEVQDEPDRDWRTLADDLSDSEYRVTGIEPTRDYSYRVRGRIGQQLLTDPSPPVSVFATLAKTRRPVTNLYLSEPDEVSVQLSWNRVAIPPYGVDEEPLLYMLEYQDEPGTEWLPLVSGIPTTSYRLSGLEPQGDYAFRVRAESQYGVSPPSTPAAFYRKSEIPRYIFEPPKLEHIGTEVPQLSWQPAVLPSYVSHSRSVSPPRYTVQYRDLGQPTWRPLVAGLHDTRYELQGLHPRYEYDFRVLLESPDYIPARGSRLTPLTTLARLPVAPTIPKFQPTISETTEPDSMRLSWQPASYYPYTDKYDPIRYRVEYQGAPELGWRTLAPRVATTSYTISDLDPDQPYMFRVKPVTDDFVGSPTDHVTLYRKPVPRLPLNEPFLSDIHPDSVRLTWKAVEPPDDILHMTKIRYVIEAQSPSGGPWVPMVTDIVDVSSRIPNLIPTQDYLFRVRAVAPDAESEPTIPVFLPRRLAYPRLPDREPYLSEITPTSVKLTWSPIRSIPMGSYVGPVTYIVETQESPSTIWKAILRKIPATSTTVSGLQPDRQYGFRVRAENQFGQSDPTRSVNLPKRAALPKMPRIEPFISDIRPGSVMLSWQPAEIPTQIGDMVPVTYDIEIRELPNMDWTPMFRRIPQTSFHVMGLLPDASYEFRVRPRTDYCQGEPSPSAFLHKPPRRSGISPELYDFDDDSVSLRWKIPRQTADATPQRRRYLIESRPWPFGDWSILAHDLDKPSFKVNQLDLGKDYLFRVRPEDTDDEEMPDIVSFFRRRYTPHVGVTRPDVYDIDDGSLRLSWQPMPFRRPRHEGPPDDSASYLTPERYTVEVREPRARSWRPLATHLPDTMYHVTGLKPRYDYEFRVRPELGPETLEPSRPISVYRKRALPPSRVDRPIIETDDDDHVRLRWKRVYIPPFDRADDNLTFMIEMQQLPASGWEVLARGIPDYSYEVRGLDRWGDYKFRVRGENLDYGPTAPSLPVSLYRSPLVPGVPIADPVIDDVQPTSVRLRWQTVYVPPYRRDEPIRFNVEGRASTDREWRSLAKEIRQTEFLARDLEPKKDYLFRLRAVSQDREISRPTPVIPVYRSVGYHEGTPIEEDYTMPLRPYIEMLTVKVPPSLPGERPTLSAITDTAATLSWLPARVPSGSTAPLYNVEQRQLPHLDWVRIADSLPATTHRITDLSGRHAYMFRVKAVNDYGSSRATLPVTLNRREKRKSQEPEYIDEPTPPAAGVKPRLPMDAPIIYQESAPDALLLKWLPARIPAYGRHAPISYLVDLKQPDGTWTVLADDLLDPRYRVAGFNPSLAYCFRVRAKSDGRVSDPTLTASYTPPKTSEPEKKKRDEMDDLTGVMPSLSPSVTGAPPRAPTGRPTVTNIQPESVTLNWTPGRVPSYMRNRPISFIVEMRQRPSPQWLQVAEGIMQPTFDVTDLDPERDYHFRVKAANEFGVSDPSLPVSLERDLKGDWISGTPIRSVSGTPLRSVTSTPRNTPQRGASADSDTEYLLRTPKDGKGIAPVLTSPQDVQYGVPDRTAQIRLNLRAFPAPIVFWFHDDDKIEYGDRVNSYATPQGEISLEISHMTADDVGDYKCYAENDVGDASVVVRLEMADPPIFLEPFSDTMVPMRGELKLRCRVDGFPAPNVRWCKDGRPLLESHRVALTHEAPDVYALQLRGATQADCGVYSCVAENVAGTANCDALVAIDGRFSSISSSVSSLSDILPDDYQPEMNLKDDNINRFYYVLEEIGRGRSGVVHRVIEKSTGLPYAAKFMPLRHPKDHAACKLEFDSLKMFNRKNVANVHDAYESERQIVLVNDFIDGPDLLTKVADDNDWSERKAANIIGQILDLLQDLHDNLIVLVDLKPTDIMFDDESDDIHLVDLGCSRRLYASRDVTSKYGSAQFSAPEMLSESPLTPAVDCWSVGVLTYILLGGCSPFYENNDDFAIISNRVRSGQVNFDGQNFTSISPEAKDFIRKLLIVEPSSRMTLAQCRAHPWLQTTMNQPINRRDLIALKSRLLSKIHAINTPGPSNCLINAETLLTKSRLEPLRDSKSGSLSYPESRSYGQFVDDEPWQDWHSRNLKRQESQVLEPNTSRESDWVNASADMKEAMRKSFRAPLLSRSSTIDESDGSVMFQRPLHDLYFTPDDSVKLIGSILSDTTPSVSWYCNGDQITDTPRIKTELSDDGTAALTIDESRLTDAGAYTCVARNKTGRVTSLAYVNVGAPPSFPVRPAVSLISNSSALIIWEPPLGSMNKEVSAYKIDFRKEGDKVWTSGPYTSNEYAIISHLCPNSDYRFRVSASNKYGASCYSYASAIASTKSQGSPELGAPTVLLDTASRHQGDRVPKHRESPADIPHRESLSSNELKRDDPWDYYTMKETLSSGKHADLKNVMDKSTHKISTAKVTEYNEKINNLLLSEVDILKPLRHEHILTFSDGYFTPKGVTLVYDGVIEGTVVDWLACKQSYTEEIVTDILIQVAEALRYLHHCGVAFLNLNPSTIVRADDGSVKLIDFHLARKVPKDESISMSLAGCPDFIAPEIVTGEEVDLSADVWSLGAFAFLLLSGQSAFLGATDSQTLSNIAYVRYDVRNLYPAVSKEGVKFIFQTIKRLPGNRLLIEACCDHEWLQRSVEGVKTRSRNLFNTQNLRAFLANRNISE